MADHIDEEIWIALGTRPTASHGCCITSNLAIRALDNHGNALLPAVERVILTATPSPGIHERIWHTNVRGVLELYFRTAANFEWDAASFVARLGDAMIENVASAVRIVWGINNDQRRAVMPKSLFDVLEQRLPENHSLLVTLRRLARIGQLTFTANTVPSSNA